MSLSPIEAAADKLLAANPPSEYSVLSRTQYHRVLEHEVCVDPTHISRAHEIIPREERVNMLTWRDKQRKRRATAERRKSQTVHGHELDTDAKAAEGVA